MQRIASLLVRFRTASFIVSLLLAAVCAVMMLSVNINTDMTKYLPAEMQCKVGQDLMTEEFGESTLFNVMVRGVPPAEREQLADDLAAFDLVASVIYEPDDAAYNNGDYALYVVSCDVGTYSEGATRAYNVITGACAVRGYECWVDSLSLDSATKDLTPVLVVAVCIAMVILFILASSWLEPLMLLFVIGMAVLINMGTNLIFGTVSETTNACGSILQMALSMDYLIMLLNRFRREREHTEDRILAMERAVTGGASAIASSSLTTVVGLLCLVLMSFTIGRDMGLVLAKGVFISLVCAFSMMPFLVLALDYWIERTAKPAFAPQMRRLAAFSYRARYPMVAVFAVLLVVGFAVKGLATANFFVASENPDRAAITQQLDLTSQVVVLYDAGEEEQAARLAARLEETEGVSRLQAYATTLGRERSAKALARELDLDQGTLRLLYYDHFKEGRTGPLQRDVLCAYLRDGLAADLGDAIDEDTAGQLDTLADLIAGELESRAYTAEEAAEALSGHASIHEGMVKLVYLAYFANHSFDSSWKMSIDGLLTFIVTDVLEDPAFDEVIDASARTELLEAYDTMVTGRDSLLGERYGRIILGVGYEDESEEMNAFVGQLKALCNEYLGAGSYYLVGQGPMAEEMAASFDEELNFITIVTVLAILLIVLVTFRNLVIPVLLVALIQCAFCLDMGLSAAMGKSIYYVALIVVQSILMGATIDYAILYTTNYRESRLACGVRQATAEAYRNSIRTIAMSGSILVFVCLILGLTAGGVTGQICLVISEGAAAAVLLVLLVLPGCVAALDRLVAKRGSAPAREGER